MVAELIGSTLSRGVQTVARSFDQAAGVRRLTEQSKGSNFGTEAVMKEQSANEAAMDVPTVDRLPNVAAARAAAREREAIENDPRIVTRADDVTANVLAGSLSIYVGPFRYRLIAEENLRDDQGNPVASIADYATQTIRFRSTFRGYSAFHAIFESMAEVFDWHYPEPATRVERHRLMATFGCQIMDMLEVDGEFRFFAPQNEKSGTSQTPDTAKPASNGSGEARAVTAA